MTIPYTQTKVLQRRYVLGRFTQFTNTQIKKTRFGEVILLFLQYNKVNLSKLTKNQEMWEQRQSWILLLVGILRCFDEARSQTGTVRVYFILFHYRNYIIYY